MREVIDGKQRFIGTARVAKHRVFVWLSCDVLPNDQVVVFARDDDYFLGILHSRLHEVWALAQGAQQREKESGFRYTPTTCFETYPMPWAPGSEPTSDSRYIAIAQAARELVQERDAWLLGSDPHDRKSRNLTRLCNENPSWLQMANERLDEAVFAVYGWDPSIGNEEILHELLALNAFRSNPVSPAAAE